MKPGDKVIYTGATDEQVEWGDNHDPRLHLKMGEHYEIEAIDMQAFMTKINLKGFPELFFNSVSFHL